MLEKIAVPSDLLEAPVVKWKHLVPANTDSSLNVKTASAANFCAVL